MKTQDELAELKKVNRKIQDNKGEVTNKGKCISFVILTYGAGAVGEW